MKFLILTMLWSFISLSLFSTSRAASFIDIGKENVVTYRQLADYFIETSHGTIVENPNLNPLLDPDLIPIPLLTKEDLTFKINHEKHQAISLNRVSPQSINELFVLDPKKYTALNGGIDFLDAKRNHFSRINFIAKDFIYLKDLITLADWHSMDHPPVMDLGKDLKVWFTPPKENTPIAGSAYFDPDFQINVDRLSGYELSFGNQLELLQNEASFQRKLKLVRHAKESILMAVMSFYCDKSSTELEEALLEKLKEGVDVKIIVEKVWTLITMKKCYLKLKNHGADFVLANDLLKPKAQAALFHNKFMVVDGSTAVIGGSNIIENDNLSTGFNRLNTDEDVQVQGPLVSDMTNAFVDLYKSYRKHPNKIIGKPIAFYAAQAETQKNDALNKGQRGEKQYKTVLADEHKRLNGVCRFVIQNPRTDRYLLSRIYIEYFKKALNSIRMQNGPYGVVQEMSEDGGPVKTSWAPKIFDAIFARTDHAGVSFSTVGNGSDAGCAEYTGLIELKLKEIQDQFSPVKKGILKLLGKWVEKCGNVDHHKSAEAILAHSNTQYWEHFDYMHTKSFQIDGIVSSVASFNFEEWSADKSHESGIICMDESLNDQVLRSFLRDAVNSTPTHQDN